MMLVNNHENWLYEYTLPLAYLHMRYPRYLVESTKRINKHQACLEMTDIGPLRVCLSAPQGPT